MKTAAVRELKNRLSSFLRLVKAGETILVTEHGRVIAELRQPQPADMRSPARIERMLQRLEHAGRLRRASRSRSIVSTLGLAPNRAVPDWRIALQETRSDRGAT